MKKIGKYTFHFFQTFISSVISLPIILLFSKFFAFRHLKKKAKKRDCWILANGPSLNDDISHIDLNKRKDFDFFVVNAFCFSDKFELLKPDFYIIIDPAYWRKTQNEVAIFIENFYFCLNDKVNWPLKLYVPFSGYRLVSKRITNSNIKLIPFNSTPVNGFPFFEFFLYNYNLGVPRLQNVVAGAIYLGILMRYKHINLLGVDHDWHKNIQVDKNNHAVWADNHFYDSSNTSNYTKIYSEEDCFDMQQIFHALSLTHQSYKKLAAYAKSNQIDVYNYTKGSCIDAFCRKEFIC